MGGACAVCVLCVCCALYCLVLCLQLCHECEMNLMLGLARLFTRSSASVEQGQVQCGWHSVKFVNIHYNLRLMTFKAGLNQHYPNARQFWWAFECATICQRGKGIQICWEWNEFLWLIAHNAARGTEGERYLWLHKYLGAHLIAIRSRNPFSPQ